MRLVRRERCLKKRINATKVRKRGGVCMWLASIQPNYQSHQQKLNLKLSPRARLAQSEKKKKKKMPRKLKTRKIVAHVYKSKRIRFFKKTERENNKTKPHSF